MTPFRRPAKAGRAGEPVVPGLFFGVTRLAAPVLALGLAARLLADTRADPDLWGHVKFGQDILAARQVPGADPYSYLSGGQPWINHEWLAEVAFAAVFGAAGAPGLVALKLLLAGLIGAVLIAHLGGLGVGEAVVLSAAFGLLWPWLGTVRPQLFTYVLFAALLVLLDRRGPVRAGGVAAMAVLFALWANLHGGVLAGLAVLLVWAGLRALGVGVPAGAPGEGRRALALLGAAVAAASVTPYGPGLLAFLLRTATVARPDITEWAPLDLTSAFGVTYLAVAALAAVGLRYSRRERDPAALAVLACTAVAPLVAVRHAPLFGLAVAVLAGRHVADAGRAAGAGLAADRLGAGRPSAAAMLRRLRPAALAGGVILALLSARDFDCVRMLPGDLPVEAIGVLERSGVAGNLAVHFDWGEYAIWRLGPRVKVSMDGRRETVYPAGVREANTRLMLGVGAWDTVLGAEGADMALVHREFPSFNLLTLAPGWHRVHADARSGLFVRGESARRAALDRAAAAPAAGPAPACFPGRPAG